MDKLNNITYDDGWKNAYSPVYKQVEDNSNENNTVVSNKKKKIRYNKPIIIIIQLILSLLVIISAFCIKTFGGDFYNISKEWYYTNLNDEIIITESFKDIDLSGIFKK